MFDLTRGAPGLALALALALPTPSLAQFLGQDQSLQAEAVDPAASDPGSLEGGLAPFAAPDDVQALWSAARRLRTLARDTQVDHPYLFLKFRGEAHDQALEVVAELEARAAAVQATLDAWVDGSLRAGQLSWSEVAPQLVRATYWNRFCNQHRGTWIVHDRSRRGDSKSLHLRDIRYIPVETLQFLAARAAPSEAERQAELEAFRSFTSENASAYAEAFDSARQLHEPSSLGVGSLAVPTRDEGQIWSTDPAAIDLAWEAGDRQRAWEAARNRLRGAFVDAEVPLQQLAWAHALDLQGAIPRDEVSLSVVHHGGLLRGPRTEHLHSIRLIEPVAYIGGQRRVRWILDLSPRPEEPQVSAAEAEEVLLSLAELQMCDARERGVAAAAPAFPPSDGLRFLAGRLAEGCQVASSFARPVAGATRRDELRDRLQRLVPGDPNS